MNRLDGPEAGLCIPNKGGSSASYDTPPNSKGAERGGDREPTSNCGVKT